MLGGVKDILSLQEHAEGSAMCHVLTASTQGSSCTTSHPTHDLETM